MPFLGDGGSQWTDGGEIHLNGPITAIELRTGQIPNSVALTPMFSNSLDFKIR